MGDRFPRVSVATVATPVIGGTPSRSVSDYWGGPIKWAAAKDVVSAGGRYIYSTEESITRNGLDNSAAKVLPRGTVIITARGTVGALAQLGEDMAFNQTCYGLVTKETVLSDFLYYALKGSLLEMRALSYGTVFDTITTRSFDHVAIPLPALSKQRAIAHILGALDDKIELNRRMNETLEAMARALFKSWFVDFDPVRAKMEGRQPHGMDAATAALFPDRFQDSELGEIPAGWTIKAVDDVAERVGMGPFGSSIKVETFVPKGVPIVSGQHLNGFMLEDNKFNFITTEHADRLSNANVRRGDVIFTHAGNIGQVAFIPECSRYERYVISQRQFFMRCDLSQVTPSYIALYFNSPEGRHRLLANTSSSGVPSIARPVTYLRTIELMIPPKPILDAFEKLIWPHLFRFRRNFDESDTLAAIRDAMLPRLLSGEIRIKDAEKFVGHKL